MMQTLQLELGERSYPIFIGPDLLGMQSLINEYVQGEQVVIISNDTVAPLYMDKACKLFAAFDTSNIVLPDGEAFKNLETLNKIFSTLLENHRERSVTLVALGGGVIGDMTGFAAACYMRGVPFIQIPTTLLSQVDSSVGGKTGVNHSLGKNMIGAFYQPKCVLCDTDTLKTLADREFSAGLAEIIKYGLIRDIGFVGWLEEHMAALLKKDQTTLSEVIHRSCTHKAEVVAADERESGQRATLNFGHTFGHAIEAGLGYGKWLHGEAIAVGMVLAADLSRRMGWITAEDLDRVKNILIAAGLPTEGPKELGIAKMSSLMSVDKKVQAGRLRLVLLKAMGHAVVTDDFPEGLLLETLDSMSS